MVLTLVFGGEVGRDNMLYDEGPAGLWVVKGWGKGGCAFQALDHDLMTLKTAQG